MPVIDTTQVECIGDYPQIRQDGSAVVRINYLVGGKPVGFRDHEMSAAEMGAIYASPGDPTISISDKIAEGIYSALITRGEISGTIVRTGA